jgi:hypothetical protein
MPRGYWVGCLNKFFEFDIRNSDQWLRKMLPEAFAIAFDENPDF